MPLVVVDASATLAWAIPDERPGHAPALLLQSYRAGQVHLAAPSVWEYEVANALKVALIRGRLSAAEALAGRGFLRVLRIELVGFSLLAEEAWAIAVENGLSMYDASYLALAQVRGCQLCTADKRVAEVAGRLGVAAWPG